MPASKSLRPFACAVLFVLTTLLLLPSGALADSTRWLPGQPGFGDMVVDEASGHVFISPGRTGSRLLVRDLDGNPQSTIAPIPGGTGMVLDGTKLYVALCDQSAISVISTTTLTEIERIQLGTVQLSGTCDLALTGGRLWFPTSDQHARIASVTTATPHTVVADALGVTVYSPLFPTATTPVSSLVVGTAGLSPSSWKTFDVTTTPATALMSAQTGSNLQDGALTANGSHVIAATGSPYYGQRFALPAITAAGQYTTGAYPKAAAVSPDGAWIAIGRDSAVSDVYVFASGSPAAVREFDLGTGLQIVPRGMRFTADASRIYAIGSDSLGKVYALSIFESPTSGTALPPAPLVVPTPSAGVAPGSTAQFALGGTSAPTDLVVDAANGHVFVAHGSAGTGITVRNLDGSAAGTIADEPGATSMVLRDGKLYVTLCGWNAIDVIDAATLTRTERIDLGTNTMGGTCSLGLANGRLFYPDSDQWVAVRSVTAAAPHTFATNVLGSTRYEPKFASSNAQPNRLLVTETGISTSTVEAYDVTASTVTRAVSASVSGYADDLAADTPGTSIGVLLHELRTSDMAITATYAGSGTMAYSPDGSWLASLAWEPYGADVLVFARGDNEPRRRFEIVGSSGEAYESTLAFSPTGDRLYAVVSPTFSPVAPTLHVINAPTAAGTAYPDYATAPMLTGASAPGSVLTCGPGTWSGSPSFTYTWRRDTTAISGATASTYTTVAGDLGKSVRCIARATNAAGGTSAMSNPIVVADGPSNTAAPTVTGTVAPGATLTCTAGTWTGSPTYAYQWRRNGAPIATATVATYVVDVADYGTTISCAVTATDANGSATAASAGVTVGSAPLNTVLPPLTGSTTAGSLLQCGTGAWTGGPTYAYAWSRGGVVIDAQVSPTYATVAADAGTVLRCTVTATNAYGTNTATSAGLTMAPTSTPDPDPTPNPNPTPDPTPNPNPTPTPPVDPTLPGTTPDPDPVPEDPEPDTTGPRITVTATRQRLTTALAGGYRIKVTCNEACTATYRVEIATGTARQLRLPPLVATSPTSSLAARTPSSVLMKFTLRARRALAARRSLPVIVKVTAVDAAGNTTTRTIRRALTRN